MSLVRRYLDLVKFEHTIFALPFAFVSLLVATGGRPPWRVLLWVVVAMVGARTAAMSFNRLVDRRLDAANPRTADRHLPAGTVSPAGAGALVAAGCLVLVAAAWRLNPLCLELSPVALAVVLGYSYLKRVSPLAHLFFPLWLAAGVMFWVTGFDTIYGIQDVDFDRAAGLHSLASRLGVERALMISRVCHVLAVACLAASVRRTETLGLAALLGVAVVAGLLAWEQAIVRGGDLRRIDKAFFEINSWVGMVFLAAVLVDLYLL